VNDEIKEILIDLIEYYGAIGTDDDPGIKVFENIAQRSSKALERHANDIHKNSADIDPYAIDVIGGASKEYSNLSKALIKHEEEL